MAELLMLKIADIHIPEVRVTATYDEEIDKELSTSIKTQGVLMPILVVKLKKGYELIDGRNRIREVSDNGATEIEAKVLDGDSTTALMYNLVTSRMRGKVKASEMVTVMKHLTDKLGLDSDAIRDKTGFTRDYIEKLLTIGAADWMVWEALDEETIGVGKAWEIARLPNSAMQQALMGMPLLVKWSVKQTRDYVDGIIRQVSEPAEQPAEPPPPKAPPPPPVCEVCGTETGTLGVHVLLDAKCMGRLGVMMAQDHVVVGKDGAAAEAPPP